MQNQLWRLIGLSLLMTFFAACGQGEQATNKRTATVEGSKIVKSGDQEAIILDESALPENFADLSDADKDAAIAKASQGLPVEEVEEFNLSYYWRIGKTVYYRNDRCVWWYNPWGNGYYCK